MKYILAYTILFLSLQGCSVPIEGVAQNGFTIANITVGKSLSTKTPAENITTVCKGFLLSKSQVRDFFVHAAYIKDTDKSNNYDILPCYSSGTALINDEEYKWTIRAGGVGEFYSEKNKFIKICGKNCCDKVSYIC